MDLETVDRKGAVKSGSLVGVGVFGAKQEFRVDAEERESTVQCGLSSWGHLYLELVLTLFIFPPPRAFPRLCQ
jgi:hypothetical protein